MAYIDTDDTDSDSADKKAANTTADDSALSTAGSGLVAGASTQANDTSQTGEKATDPTQSGWQDLSAYLNANSDQATQMGNQVASGVTSQVQGAKSSLDDLSNTFNTQASAGATPLDTQKSFIDQAVSDPTTYANDSSKLGQIQNDLSGTYSGPNSLQDLSDYQKVVNNFNNAQSAVGLTGSEAGRDQLLKQTYSRPDYTAGQANLDQMLLANNPASQDGFAKASSQWAGLTGALNSATTNSQATASQIAANNKATSDYAKSTLASAQTSAQDELSKRVADQTAQEQAANDHYNQLKDALASKSLTTDQAAELGLPQQDFLAYNVDLSKYLGGYNNQVANTSNVATAADAAKISALYKLAGEENGYSLDPTQFGTFKQTPITYDPAAKGAIQNRTEWNSMLTNTKAGAAGFSKVSPGMSIQDTINLWSNPSMGKPILNPDGTLTPYAQQYIQGNPNDPLAKDYALASKYATGSGSTVKVTGQGMR